MKYTIKPLVVIILTVLTVFGCEQDQVPPKNGSAVDIQRHGELEFVYQLTDMEGNPKASFQEGENFLFSFTIKNHGNDTASVCNCYIPLDIDDFFKVYRIHKGESNDYKEEIGKPYYGVGGTLDAPVTEVKEKSTFGYEIPWVAESGEYYPAPHNNTTKTGGGFAPNENDPLPKGDYYSGFTLELKDQELSFEISFSVQ